MLSFINIDQQILQTQSAVADPVKNLSFPRNTNAKLKFGLVLDDGSGTLQDLGAVPGGINIKAIVKSATGDQRYDEAATITVTGFVRTVISSDVYYEASLFVGGPLIDKQLGIDNVSQPEIVQVTCVNDVAGNLAGRHFVLYDVSSQVWVWLKVSGAGTQPVGPNGTRYIEVDVANNANASTIATAIATAFAADTGLNSAAVGSVVTFTDKKVGYRGNADGDNTGFSVVITQAGADAFTRVDQDQWNATFQVQFDRGNGWEICQLVPLTVTNSNDRNDNATIQQVAMSSQKGEVDVGSGVNFVTITFSVPFPATPSVVIAGPIRKISPGDADPPPLQYEVSRSATQTTIHFAGPTSAAAKLPFLALP